MAARIVKKPKYETFADVLDRVGNVPPHRVLLNPPPGTATELDLLDSTYTGDRGCELVNGVLVEKTMGFREDYIATNLIFLFRLFLQTNNFGAVAGSQGLLRFKIGLVRVPDVTFIRWDSVDDTDEIENPDGAFLEVAPDFVVEVLSPSNSTNEMSMKLDEYSKAGVKLVWYVDPDRKEVAVFPNAKAAAKKIVGVEGVLDGGTVMPGFRLPVKEIFASRAPQKKTKGKGRK